MAAKLFHGLNAFVMRTIKVAKSERQGAPDSTNLDLAHEVIGSPADVRLRESNHRIKNHLQVLAAALALQSRQSDDELARQALLEACGRVAAIGRIHQRLEEANFSDKGDVSLFLRDLCTDMRACLAPERADLRLEVDVDPAAFSAERMLSVGLMVSELVTNAVKHGSVGNMHNVRVSLKREGRNWRLTVADDGPGMEFSSLATRPNLGGRLLFAMATQLDGSVEQDATAKGASISVLFPQ